MECIYKEENIMSVSIETSSDWIGNLGNAYSLHQLCNLTDPSCLDRDYELYVKISETGQKAIDEGASLRFGSNKLRHLYNRFYMVRCKGHDLKNLVIVQLNEKDVKVNWKPEINWIEEMDHLTSLEFTQMMGR